MVQANEQKEKERNGLGKIGKGPNNRILGFAKILIFALRTFHVVIDKSDIC